MKIKFIFFTLLVYFLFSISVFGQTYSGKITQIIDGKTAILTLSDGKQVNIWLRFLEVPEPEQQLSQTAKEHLEKLILNKDVRFAFYKNYSQGWVGVLYLNETDVSMQMLRDGAAWFDAPENDGYGSEYRKMENLAKSEKRGVWGIEGLKPPWEFRAEKFDKKIQAKKEAQAKLSEKRKQESEKKSANVGIWADVPTSRTGISKARFKNLFGTENTSVLSSEYDRFSDLTIITSPYIQLGLKKNSKQLEDVTLKAAKSFKGKKPNGIIIYTLAFVSIAGECKFSKSYDSVILTDNLRFTMDNGVRDYEFVDYFEANFCKESILFSMTKETFEKIVNSDGFDLRLGGYEGDVTKDELETLKLILR